MRKEYVFLPESLDELENSKGEAALCDVIAMLSHMELFHEAGYQQFKIFHQNVLDNIIGHSSRVYGDFCLPESLIRYLVELFPCQDVCICDPCCRTGAFLSAAIRCTGKNVKLYGQAPDPESRILCEMNIKLNKLEINLGASGVSALTDDLYAEKHFDVIITNPPFNRARWDEEDETLKDKTWQYGRPPKSNSNFAWLQYILSHLNEQGQAIVVMPNGSLTSSNSREHMIRKAITDSGAVEAIFSFPDRLLSGTKVPFCVWLLNRRHKNEEGILMVAAENFKPPITRKTIPSNPGLLIDLLTEFRNGKLPDKTETYAVVHQDEIIEKRYILSPNLYVSSKYQYENIISNDILQFQNIIHNLQRLSDDKNFNAELAQWLPEKENFSEDCKWEHVPLKVLYEISGGMSKKRKEFGHGFPLLDTRLVIGNWFVPDNLELYENHVNISQDELEKYNIRSGDIFLNRTSESTEKLACCCVAMENHEKVYSGFVKRLRPYSSEMIPEYAAAYFHSWIYRKQIIDISPAFTTRASINNSQLRELMIYFPPHCRQQKIGSVISMVFKKLRGDPNHEFQALLKEFLDIFINFTISYPIVHEFKR